MDTYLKRAIKCWLIAVAIIWLWVSYGCASAPQIQTYCVPNSILSAWTWGAKTGDPVRIAVTSIKPGLDHSQAEAKINGKWTPLTEIWNGDNMEIRPYKRHFDKAPYRYQTLQGWINEQIKFTNQNR